MPNVRLNIHLIPLACRLGSGGTFGTCPNDGDEGFLPAPISKVIIGSNGVLSEEQYDPENLVLMFDVVYQDLTQLGSNRPLPEQGILVVWAFFF